MEITFHRPNHPSLKNNKLSRHHSWTLDRFQNVCWSAWSSRHC